MSPHKKKRRTGHTLTMLWIWIGLVPLSMILQGIFDLMPTDFPGHGLALPQGTIVTFAGLGSFSYLGIEYASQIFQNSKMPAGHGTVASLTLYKTLAYIWLSYYLLAVAVAAFIKMVPPLPLTELATFAGTVMLSYVAGQKGSKLSVNMGGVGADFSGNGPSTGMGGYGSMASPGLSPVWTQPQTPPAPAGAPTATPQAPSGPAVPR